MAWLRQNSASLDDVETLEFNGYTLQVSRRDFNVDGTDDWLILAHHEDNDQQYPTMDYRQYLVVMRDADRGYQLIDTPLPWFGTGYHYSSTPSGDVEPLRFEDINADGLPEWVVAFGGVGANSTVRGSLYVLAWRDNALVEIAPWQNHDTDLAYYAPAGGGMPVLTSYVHWKFPNLDEDNALEIQQIQEFDDNWGCVSFETRTFDWDAQADRYVFVGTNLQLEDTLGCSLRQAQEAMWNNNLSAAIQWFEHGFAQGDTDHAGVPVQYAQIRLAVAYALNGQSNEAAVLLDDLMTQEPTRDLMGAFIDALTQLPTLQPLAVCAAAYKVAQYSDPWEMGALSDTMLNVVGPSTIGFPRADASAAGCDLPRAIDDMIASHQFPTDRDLVEQLTDIGLIPAAAQSFDLDQDEQSEWLVWVAPRIDPLYFAPVGDGYHVSRPAMLTSDEWNTMLTMNLPSDTGLALINHYVQTMRTDEDERIHPEAYTSPPNYQCYPEFEFEVDETVLKRGYVRMWRLDTGELLPIADFFLCADRTLDEFFPNGSKELHAWAPITPLQRTTRVAPAVYHWDDNTQTYQPPTPEILEADLNIPVPDEKITHSLENILADIQNHWPNDGENRSEWATELERAVADLDPDVDQRLAHEARYWYALVLELSGQPDQAVAQFVAIYTSAPDSAWGMMAKLHLTTES